MTLHEFRDMLYDPEYDISADGYQSVEIVKHIRESYASDLIDEITQQMLLRIMQSSPWVYAITVGQFPEFDGIDHYWEESGYTDTSGFLWLIPAH